MGNFRSGSQGGFGSNRRSSFGGRRSFDRGDRDSGDRGFRSGGFSRGPRRDDRGEGRGFGDRERRDFQEKFRITCDKCGKEDEVPFKPTQGKPILCKECFDANKPAPIQDQLDSINEKLEKIMKNLDIK